MEIRRRGNLASLVLAAACLLSPLTAALAQETPQQWRIGIATVGEQKYAPGFTHFDYVNPNAPKAVARFAGN